MSLFQENLRAQRLELMKLRARKQMSSAEGFFSLDKDRLLLQIADSKAATTFRNRLLLAVERIARASDSAPSRPWWRLW